MSSRRGSAIAGIVCGLPVIAYSGSETAPPFCPTSTTVTIFLLVVEPPFRLTLHGPPSLPDLLVSSNQSNTERSLAYRMMISVFPCHGLNR
jgi:hypothetical protein